MALTAGRAGRWVVGSLVWLAALGVVWRVLAFYGAMQSSTGEALGLRTPSSRELAATRALFAGDLAAARAEAAGLQQARPISGAPHRLYGEIARREGDLDRTRRHLQQALALNPRDAQARLWLADDAKARGDLATYARHQGLVASGHPGFRGVAFRGLAGLLAEAQGADVLVALLATAPAWRESFLAQLFADRAQPLAVVDDLAARLDAKAGLTAPERERWLAWLVGQGQLKLARQRWESALPAGRQAGSRVPVNGDFESPPAPPPFDWLLDRVDGATALVDTLPEGEGRGLRVEFAGRRIAFRHVRQLLQLPPGAYRLAWRSRLEGLESPVGLRWVLECADPRDPKAFATGPALRGTSGWRLQRFEFTAPPDCRSQWLVLELGGRIAAERQAYGTAWFDDVQVLPVSSAR